MKVVSKKVVAPSVIHLILSGLEARLFVGGEELAYASPKLDDVLMGSNSWMVVGHDRFDLAEADGPLEAAQWMLDNVSDIADAAGVTIRLSTKA